MNIRAKFTVDKVTHTRWGSEEVTLNAVCADQTEENKAFAAASPSGTLTITVDNPAVKGAFKPGQSYYLDFTPVPSV